MSARIALIHALEESVAPCRAAFAEIWPEAYAFDLLDASLSADLAAQGGAAGDALQKRFHDLATYVRNAEGRGGRTQAILFTCSAFGPLIEAVRATSPIPVLKPNEAAFEAALDAGSNIGLVVTFGPSEAALAQEMQDMAARRGKRIQLRTIVAEGALDALKAGDGEAHDQLAAEAAAKLGEVDIIVLGQFSLARARAAVEAHTGLRALTTPHSAVRALQALLQTRS